MGNMSYRMFQNTSGDLAECEEAMNEMGDPETDLSPDEYRAFVRLVRQCRRIADDFPDVGED